MSEGKKEIFYRVKENNDCFKVTICTEDQKQIDYILDILTPKNTEIINEFEFIKAYDEFMTLDVFDPTNSFKIAELCTKKINIDDFEENEILTFKAY